MVKARQIERLSSLAGAGILQRCAGNHKEQRGAKVPQIDVKGQHTAEQFGRQCKIPGNGSIEMNDQNAHQRHSADEIQIKQSLFFHRALSFSFAQGIFDGAAHQAEYWANAALGSKGGIQHIGAGRTLGGGFKCSADIAVILGQQRHQPEIRLRLQRRQPLRECRPPHQQTAAIGQRRRGFIQRERAIQHRQFCLCGRFLLLPAPGFFGGAAAYSGRAGPSTPTSGWASNSSAAWASCRLVGIDRA